MPVYDVKCNDCGNTVEKILKINDDNPRCELCNGETHRLMGTPVFSGNGGGWCGSKSQRKHGKGR